MAEKTVSDLSEVERERSEERFQVIRPFLEEGVPLVRIAAAQGKSLRTLRYWVSDFKEQGLPGLVRKSRSDCGGSRMRTELKALVQALWLGEPRRPVTSIYRQAVREAEAREWEAPSYDQVLKVIRSLDPSLATLSREGTKAYKQTLDLLVRFEASGPNQIWQADHKHLGIWLSDDTGKPKKPWLTAIEDDYSRAVCGYYLGFEAPSSQRTALALRQAVWRKSDPAWPVCGIPQTFYTDHGPDFESIRMEQVAADIRMKLDYSMVGEPRGRGKIERFFRTIEQMFLCELPGFSPGKEKPRNSDKKPNKPKRLLNLPEFDSLFREWLLGVYHGRQHGGTGQIPTVRWEENILVPRIPDSLEQLDLLLLTVATTRRIGRDGIRFSNHVYTDLTLAPYIGEDVVIRYDPRDMGEIRVYLDGAFLCRAICSELADNSYTYKEVREANSRNRRRLRAERRDIEAAARDLLELRNHSTIARASSELDEIGIQYPPTTLGEQKPPKSSKFDEKKSDENSSGSALETLKSYLNE